MRKISKSKLEIAYSKYLSESGDVENLIKKYIPNLDFSIEHQPSDGFVLSVEREVTTGITMNVPLDMVLSLINSNQSIDEKVLNEISI